MYFLEVDLNVDDYGLGFDYTLDKPWLSVPENDKP